MKMIRAGLFMLLIVVTWFCLVVIAVQCFPQVFIPSGV